MASTNPGLAWTLARDGKLNDLEEWVQYEPDIDLRFKPAGQDKNTFELLMAKNIELKDYPLIRALVFKSAHYHISYTPPNRFDALAEEVILPEYRNGLEDVDRRQILNRVGRENIKTVVLELDDVLVRSDPGANKYEMRKSELVWMNLWSAINRKSPDHAFLFEMLTKHVPESDRFRPDLQTYRKGLLVPPILCLWLSGVFTSSQTLGIITEALSAARDNRTIKSVDAHVAAALARKIIEIDALWRTHTISKTGLALLRGLNRKNVRIALLSNCSLKSFARARDVFSTVFDFIKAKDILVSAEVERVKPDPIFYVDLRDRIGFDVAETLLVDSEPAHVMGALKVYGHAYLTGGSL